MCMFSGLQGYDKLKMSILVAQIKLIGQKETVKVDNL